MANDGYLDGEDLWMMGEGQGKKWVHVQYRHNPSTDYTMPVLCRVVLCCVVLCCDVLCCAVL